MKRNVTFGSAAGIDGANNGASEERSPLLREPIALCKVKALSMERIGARLKEKSEAIWTFAKSNTGKGVFKCSIAYLLGSLATFIPTISSSLGQQDGKHMVATITVYFHPARSVGSMFEAMMCAAVAFLYAVFISFSSMAISIFFGRTLDLIVLGHIIVLVVFCGGGMGFIGWTKQRLGHPLVNISCSLTSLAIITVLTKEGAVQAAEFSDDKVTQVMVMILMGVAATTAVSFMISPISARKGLRSDLVHITDSIGDQLTLITRAFLKGSEEALQKQSYVNALEKYQKAFSSMTKNLKEARYEHYVLGTEREYHLETKIVSSMQRLGQNTGGLRSAATTQFVLLKEPEVTSPQTYFSHKSLRHRVSSSRSYDGIMSEIDSPWILEPIDETPEHRSSVAENATMMESMQSQSSEEDGGSFAPVSSSSDIFAQFIMELGPSMVRSSSLHCTHDTKQG